MNDESRLVDVTQDFVESTKMAATEAIKSIEKTYIDAGYRNSNKEHLFIALTMKLINESLIQSSKDQL